MNSYLTTDSRRCDAHLHVEDRGHDRRRQVLDRRFVVLPRQGCCAAHRRQKLLPRQGSHRAEDLVRIPEPDTSSEARSGGLEGLVLEGLV